MSLFHSQYTTIQHHAPNEKVQMGRIEGIGGLGFVDSRRLLWYSQAQKPHL